MLNVKVDGTALTQADIDDAEDLGYTDGKTYILWVGFDDLTTADSITFTTVDGSKTAKTISLAQSE